MVAAAKAIGGVEFAYAVKGDGREAASPVAAAQQRAALDAALATLQPEALRVPPALVPLLSAAQNGTTDRQYETEIFTTAGGPVFDPLAAAERLEVAIRANVFLYVLLPTLLFQVSLGLNLRRMADDWVPILVMAVMAVSPTNRRRR